MKELLEAVKNVLEDGELIDDYNGAYGILVSPHLITKLQDAYDEELKEVLDD